MTLKTIFAAGCASAIALSGATAAFAQAPAARPAAPASRPAGPAAAPAAGPAIRNGPVIPGVCVVSQEAVVENSTVGKAVTTRLQQLAQQVDAELNGEKNAIETEEKTLNTQYQAKQIDESTARQKAAVLDVRKGALQDRLGLRRDEYQATQRKQYGRVVQEMQSVVAGAYQAKNCSILIASGVMIANPDMDLTGQVIAGLNAKITTLQFDRERLDQQAPSAATPRK